MTHRQLRNEKLKTMPLRAYVIGIKGYPQYDRTEYAPDAGRAKGNVFREVSDCWPDFNFKHLTCKSLGLATRPPTKMEIAQRECDAFNAKYPVGTMLRYWTWKKEGEPTGIAPIKHEATVMPSGNPVAWMTGVAACVSLSHVEAVGA